MIITIAPQASTTNKPKMNVMTNAVSEVPVYILLLTISVDKAIQIIVKPT